MSTQKIDYELYLLSRKHVGEIITSKEALEIFGYAKSTYICKTLIMKYLQQITPYGQKPKKFMVRNFAALDDDTINKLTVNTLEYKINRAFGFKKIRKTDLYLVSRQVVSFWMLKEFGGKII